MYKLRMFICPRCRLSKYHSQKPESTRRTIFNRGSTLQHIVQISSGNVNSSVRARAKTHGCTPVSIELPRGRHSGSDACISLVQTPASFGLECPQLHCTRVHNNGLQTPASSMCKSTIQDMGTPKRYTRPSLHAPRGACIFLTFVQMMPAPSPYTHVGDIRAPYLCVRPRHARATPAACVQAMHAPLFL